MLNMNQKLIKRQQEGKIIRTGIVGAGQMGRGMVTQMALMQGITPAIVSDIAIENAIHAFNYAGIKDDQIAIVNTLTEANKMMEMGKFVATTDANLVSQANLVECAIDATGVPDVGAKVATDAMKNGKHCVMLNVETDVVIGPYLKKLAQQQGVIYTGSAGDEPGAVMELYCFAKAIGMDVKVMGKGKNNKLDYDCNPDSVLEEATRRKMSPKMLCSFKDGTKTMVEMTAMSNATGLVPDIIGGHGIVSDVKGLADLCRLKQDGGVLNKHGVVEYVNGIAPGVFVAVSTENEEIAYQMRYHSMGNGPLWILYRPYHLCNLETPLTVAKAVIDGETTIVPMDGLVSECITVAKTDLKAGQTIDGIGGFTTYGSIATATESDAKGYVPYGLVNKNTKMLKDVKKGQLITKDMVQLDTSTLIYKLRQEQDKMYGK
ncbi:Predicted homoserine dehydrogenase, contains C-terminal SAF domain [Propionispira arboris]|uniref:Predicted homoserine dehydrogenase, contains C-terminal SAF domain n=1 Tax=Propionispira arboris TaxID=84035 RepID=A0A1H6YCD4_9FIRM|nr:NAD(P)-dependent oxidoreductase [Propionispira arboris]SEJ37564.1 Predicted homoserine dehydrogenase, contains C-terminal SAF domain [Propionispira arboris]